MYVCMYVYVKGHNDSVKGLAVDSINEYLVSAGLDGYIKVHTYTHTYVHTYTHTYTHSNRLTYLYINISTHTHTHTYIHTHIRMHPSFGIFRLGSMYIP